MSLVNPVPLLESWRIPREVINGLSEPLLGEFFDRWLVELRVLNGELSGVGVLLSLTFDKLKVYGLWTVCKSSDLQREAEQAIET